MSPTPEENAAIVQAMVDNPELADALLEPHPDERTAPPPLERLEHDLTVEELAAVPSGRNNGGAYPGALLAAEEAIGEL